MSGTAFGTVILHVNPEADAGGPLGLVRDGDLIALDGPGRSLNLLVDEAELERRRADPDLARPASPYVRGWAKLYVDTVLQADRGCDLDFLVGASGEAVSRESH
jgi:dihydroxy-acid dehydratase